MGRPAPGAVRRADASLPVGVAAPKNAVTLRRVLTHVVVVAAPSIEPRSKNLTVRCTASEIEWFNAVAAAQNVSLSDLVRSHLAVDGARLGVPVPAALAS